jgi:hypothetical protein
MDVRCDACGETTAEAVYRIQRLRRLECRVCGAWIDLRSEQVQLEAERAEHRWRAEWMPDKAVSRPRGDLAHSR